jgi:hypothetical protein
MYNQRQKGNIDRKDPKVWEMKQERKQPRKDVERHTVIKGENEQINQDTTQWSLNFVSMELKNASPPVVTTFSSYCKTTYTVSDTTASSG